jgi:iron complex transport system substrate-binding protein
MEVRVSSGGAGLRRAVVGLVAVIIGTLAVGCGATPAAQSDIPSSGTPATGYPRTVTDPFGTATEIRSADRIVTAYGSVSDIVFRLGEGARLAGRDNLSADWPPGEIEKIPAIGDYSELNVEGITATGADLFIVPDRNIALADNVAVLDQLRAAGVTVLVLPEEQLAKRDGRYTVAGITTSVRMVADALGVPEKGAELVGEIERAERATAANVAAYCRPPRLMTVRAFGPDRVLVVGSGGPGELFLSLLGGVNVAAEAGLVGFAQPDPEAIPGLRPEVILGRSTYWEDGKDGVAFHAGLPGFEQTPAAEQKRILPVDDRAINNSWRMVEFAEEVSRQLAALPC